MKQERTIVITRNYMIVTFLIFFITFFSVIGGLVYANNMHTMQLIETLSQTDEDIKELTNVLEGIMIIE